jgi:hypothetical protein
MSLFDDFDASAGNYSSIPDGSDGYDILHDGTIVDNLKANGAHDTDLVTNDIAGGKEIVHPDGQVTGIRQNALGGSDVYHDQSLDHFTISNALGGEDFYNSNFENIGHTTPNSLGGEDYTAEPSNEGELMTYDDPLAHVAELRLPPYLG